MLYIKKMLFILFFIVSILSTDLIKTNHTTHYINHPCMIQTSISNLYMHTTQEKITSTYHNYYYSFPLYFKRLYYCKKIKKPKHEHSSENECHEEENDEHDEGKEAEEPDGEDSLHGQEAEEDDNDDDKKQRKNCKKILLALCNTLHEQDLVLALNNEQASYLLSKLML